MDSITIDGLPEDAFRGSIEDMLRRGLSDEALSRLRRLLEPLTGEGALFPARFMAVNSEDIELSGWEALDEGFRKFDRPEQPVTAICLSFGDPESGSLAPDAAGLLSLTVETAYFSDEAFPFSESDRNDLLDGYSTYGCQWAGDCEGVDNALSFRGVDDLHGSLASLEQRLLATHNPDPEEIKAGTIASCYLAVLFHQALRDSFAKRRLGRPLCVLTANNGVYPSFDAPVLACDEFMSGGDVIAVAAAAAPQWVPDDSYAPAHASEEEGEAPEEASLLSIGIRRTSKQPVLALADGDDDMSIDAMANAALGGGPLPPPPPAYSYDDYAEPAEPEMPVSAQDVFEDPSNFVELSDEPEAAEPADSAASAPIGPGDVEFWSSADLPGDEAIAEAEPELCEAEAEAIADPLEEAEPEPAAIDMVEPEPDLAPEPEPEPALEQAYGDTEWPAREEEPPADIREAIEAVYAADEPQSEPEDEPMPTRTPGLPGHSLRAKLGTAEAEIIEPDKPSLWARLVDWIEAKLRRR